MKLRWMSGPHFGPWAVLFLIGPWALAGGLDAQQARGGRPVTSLVPTTVVGSVVDRCGVPAAGIQVRDAHLASVTTRPNGFFVLATQVVPGRPVRVFAEGTIDGLLQSASSVPTAVVPNGITDVGILELALPPTPAALFAARQFPVGQDPVAQAAADLDGDGRLDLVVANIAAGSVTVVLGAAGATFGPPSVYPTGTLALLDVAVGDVDGDGILDVVAASLIDDVVVVLPGIGDGSLGPITSWSVPTGVRSIALGDVDGDGDLDVVTADSFLGVSLLTNQGDGSFVASVVSLSPGFDVVTADLNADGALDLALADESTDELNVLFGNGDGTFGTESRMATGGLDPAFILATDLDLDGQVDLVVLNPFSSDLSVFLGTGAGTFGAPTLTPTGGFPRSATAADLDADGLPELLVANAGSNNLALLPGSGDGTFGALLLLPVNFPTGVVPADLDSDGRIDLAVVQGIEAGKVQVVLGAGDLVFATSGQSTSGVHGVAAVGGDFDGDGRLDVAVADDDVEIVVLGGDGNGAFAPLSSTFPAFDPTGLAAGDLDEDGALDLVATYSPAGQPQKLLVLTGNGNGTFGAPLEHATPDQPRGVILADFDGDSHLDAAVPHDQAPGIVSLFLGDGTGSLAAAGTFPTSSTNAFALTAGDFDADGRLDLAVANHRFGGSVSVLLGNEPSGFAPATVYPAAGQRPTSIESADLDGDGDLDLVVLCPQSTTFSVLLGEGNGLFGPALPFAAGDAPQAFALTDVDLDCVLDIALVSPVNRGAFPGSGVFVRLGLSDGTFGDLTSYALPPGTAFPSGVPRGSIVCGDLDGDGDPDLVTVNSEGTWVDVLLNRRVP